jgi:hypothetical protein
MRGFTGTHFVSHVQHTPLNISEAVLQVCYNATVGIGLKKVKYA